MVSQSTLVWVGGAAASTVVAAGAVAGALLWTHPSFLWPNPAPPQAVARAPEPMPPRVPPAAPAVETAAPAASAPAAGEAADSPLKPAFDVVNVEPAGDAVIAGRAAPNAKVELRDAGKTVAEATADASGQFVIIPPALAPGEHSLSLAADAGKGTSETSEAIAVSIPEPETKPVVAAAPAPAAAPSSSPALAMRTLATPPSAASRVAIQSVEADAAGGLIARGSAEPNATVRLYLNGADVADAKTQSDGRWSLTIKHGMTPGGYVMRADEINPGDASVVASANTPFDYPAAGTPAPAAAPATAPAPAEASAGQPNAPSSADAVVETVQTAQVVHGHTLWALSQNYYGDPTRYPVIYEANKSQIHNPNLIFPGQVFVVPKFEPKP
jgi:nucleoid-associated protein YgaU